jgi:hypothetical protein
MTTTLARTVLLILLLGASATAQELTVEPKADRLLKEMGIYLKGLDEFSFHLDTVQDQETSSCWVEFASAVDVFVRRPDGFKLARTGDKGRAEVYYDGKSVALYNPDKQFYARADAPATIPETLDFLNDKLGVTLPVADLLFPDSYEVLTDGMESGFYVGLHPVLGVPCHHLSFISKGGIEWQIWIEDGKMRVPRKLVIRYVDQPGVPRFAALFSDWDPNTPLARDLFRFEIPEQAQEIDFLPPKGAK